MRILMRCLSTRPSQDGVWGVCQCGLKKVISVYLVFTSTMTRRRNARPGTNGLEVRIISKQGEDKLQPWSPAEWEDKDE